MGRLKEKALAEAEAVRVGEKKPNIKRKRHKWHLQSQTPVCKVSYCEHCRAKREERKNVETRHRILTEYHYWTHTGQHSTHAPPCEPRS